MKQYIIINKITIQEKIEELEDKIKNDGLFPEETQHYKGQINSLKQIVSQSTPLIPEIEKAFKAGKDGVFSYPNIKNYISKLKLDI